MFARTILLVAFAMLASASLSHSQDFNACLADAQRLCPGVAPGGGRIAACFREHSSDLSQPCRDAIANRGSASGASGAAPTDVPAQQHETYSALAQILAAARIQYRPENLTGLAKPEYFTDLLAANSNAGEALLRSQTMEAVRLSLDRFKEMGFTGVKFALQYPLLRPDFPHAASYLAFYRQVAQEAHSRGLKIMPHVTVLFGDTDFSPFRHLYEGLSPERFTSEYREMVHLVVRELHPEYLGLITEPDTLVRLTGLAAFGQPDAEVRLVNAVLEGFDRGSTRICAGAGSWNGVSFAAALAQQTSVDAICIHIYPIQGQALENAVQMARIARASHKLAFIDEAWLYKTATPGGGNNVAAAANVFGQDFYTFWQPLDQQFLAVVNALARREDVSLLSFYWSRQFFAYLDGAQGGDTWRSRSQAENRAAFAAMTDGRFSQTGTTMRALIGGP